jgi:hypothetical protein
VADVVRDPEQDLTRICSWCGCIIYQGRARMPSHGICAGCLTRELIRQREEQRRWGRAVDAPVAHIKATP